MKYTFPRQALSYRRKTKDWVKQCIDYADHNSVLSSSLVRKTVAHKKLNYDFLNGKIHMDDLIALTNPEGFKFNRKDINQKITHYPIVNRIVNLLEGEEASMDFNYKVVVTNPTAISERENIKKNEIMQNLQMAALDQSMSEEEFQQRLEQITKYFAYDFQDIRELRANQLLNHYSKEQNFNNIFNDGFVDVLTVNEGIFQCSIEGGEPVLRRLNPCKVHAYGNGSSNRLEDADMIVIEDYWQVGRIIDTYHDQLSKKDIDFLENIYDSRHVDDRYNEYGDPLDYLRFGEYYQNLAFGDDGYCFKDDGVEFSQLPYDLEGNVRVLQVYWKSLRKIKKVKSYDPVTGKERFNFYTEDYICNTDLGEEEEVFYINEAWNGVMIGAGEKAIYVNLGPCKVQYNRLSNPSRCHFGIVGQIFNYNESRPYSIIDMTKQFSYLYDVTMDKLVRTMNNNLGKLIQLNTAVMPREWDFEKWVYYAKTAGIVLIDTMKEGNKGAAKGKLGGAFQSSPVIDAELGNSIQSMIATLQYIEQALCNLVGITPQRLGAIQNRETVGGVERSTLQSSHVTRWYFEKFNDLKKRVYECFLETAKIASRGKDLKFQYITSDLAQKTIEIDGDEFSECDYGLVVDNSYDSEKLKQQIEQTAQIALQSQMISFSAYLKLQSTSSMSEKVKMIETSEQEMRQLQQQNQQMMLQQQQQQAEMEMQAKQLEMEQQDKLNERDNDTKILVAQINASNQSDTTSSDQEKLNESIRQFNEKLNLDKDKLMWEKQKNTDNNKVKLDIAKMKPKTIKK